MQFWISYNLFQLIRSPLSHICIQEDAQRKIIGLLPITPTTLNIIIHSPNFWVPLSQIIKTTKLLVDTIKNLKSHKANPGDCMLEII